MITQELIDYIKYQINLGSSQSKFRKVLIENGWRKEDIEKALKQVTIADKKLATRLRDNNRKSRGAEAKFKVKRRIKKNKSKSVVSRTRGKTGDSKKNSAKKINSKKFAKEKLFTEKKSGKKSLKLKRAGFWLRAGAFFLDIFFAPLIGSVLTIPVYLTLSLFNYAWPAYLSTVITFWGVFLYFFLFSYIFSATIGEKIYGLVIVNEKNLKPLNFWKSFFRTFPVFAFVFLLAAGLRQVINEEISYLIIAFVVILLSFISGGRSKKGIHDFLTKAFVARKFKSLRFPISLTFFLLACLIPSVISLIRFQLNPFEYLPDESEQNFNELMTFLEEKPENFQEMLKETDSSKKDYSVSLSEGDLEEIRDDVNTFYEKQKESVVSILTGYVMGTGFVIDSEEGLIVTSYHVVADAERVAVASYDNEKYEVEEVIDFSKEKDLVVLKISKIELPAVKIAGLPDQQKIGDEVFSIGHPLGIQNTLSEGIITGFQSMDKVEYIQFDAPISVGNSGGPLFNSRGEVIAVSTFMYQGQNLNFGVQIDELFNLDFGNVRKK